MCLQEKSLTKLSNMDWESLRNEAMDFNVWEEVLRGTDS